MASQPDPSTVSPALARAKHLLHAIAHSRTPDFTGVGLVFYDGGLSRLPHLQLTSDGAVPDPHQFADVDLTTAFTAISMSSSPLHDGFHFIDARSWSLTHLCQFISPPIPPAGERTFHGTGARLMAALLASLLPGIQCVGLVSRAGETYLFSGGVEVAKD